MRRCVFLTTDNLAGYIIDDELALGPLNRLGWEVETISWREHLRNAVDWNRYDAVVIRTTWDYHKEPDAFIRTLGDIDRSRAKLANPLELVRWNVHKSYLRELEERGLRTVPTVWGRGLAGPGLVRAFETLEADDIVLKPAIGASADDTFRLSRGVTDDDVSRIGAIFEARDYMVQRFIPAIIEEGEYSLFFFDGKYSHTVLKTPKAKDFRVQEEHGGNIQGVEIGDGLMERGLSVMEMMSSQPLYARVDLVRLGETDEAESFALMELELIEPALYLQNHPEAASNFAVALDEWMRR